MNTTKATNTNTTSIAEPLGKCEPTQSIDNDSAVASAASASVSTKEIIETLDKSLGNPEPEPQLYTSPASSALKHFECTEVDIDFKNISDVIDTKEPAFDVSPTATGATAAKWKQNNSGSGGGGLTLKKHKEVIYEMYKVAKRKAQEAKKAAIRAYLEAKEIKASYLLDDLDDFDSGSDDDI
jgi:hypothetical protein